MTKPSCEIRSPRRVQNAQEARGMNRGVALVLVAMSLGVILLVASLFLFVHWYSYHTLLEQQNVDLASVAAVNESDGVTSADDIADIATRITRDNFRGRVRGQWSRPPSLRVLTSPGTGSSPEVDTVSVFLAHSGVSSLFPLVGTPSQLTVQVQSQAVNLRLAVMLVIDHSESMDGPVPCALGQPWRNGASQCWKMDEALSAVRNFISNAELLPIGSWLGMASFNNGAAIVPGLSMKRLVENIQDPLTQISRQSAIATMQYEAQWQRALYPRESTNIARAFEVSVEHYLANRPAERHLPVLILLSDGGPNSPAPYQIGQQYNDGGVIRTRYELLHTHPLRSCIMQYNSFDFSRLASLFYADYYARASNMIVFTVGYGTPIPPVPNDPFNHTSSLPPGHDWQFVNLLNRLAGHIDTPVDFPCLQSFGQMSGMRGRAWAAQQSNQLDTAFAEIARSFRSVLVPN